VKLQPRPPTWLPSLLHLAHGLVAFGAGYLLAHSAVLYNAASPGSLEANVYLGAAVALALFEIGYLAYFIARRRRLRNLWREASRLVRADQFEAAKLPLTELLTYSEYRLAPQPALFALGACEEGLGRQREALVLYRRCGDFEPALRAIGMLQLERGFHEGAADALRKLVARRPDDLISVVLLALALVRGGHRDAAARALRRALELRPKSEMLIQNLSRVEAGEEPALSIERRAK
jgi:tetratricopeptide (TPR) repeat protein